MPVRTSHAMSLLSRQSQTGEGAGCLRLDWSFVGNASQVSDGAAAVVLARRSVAQKMGLTILGKFVISAVVGVPPKIMG